MSDVRVVIVEILRDLFGDRPEADLSDLRDEVELQTALDLDSMDAVDIAMELESRLDVEIEAKPSDLRTLGALISAVEAARPPG